MTLYRFESGDVVRQRIETHPRNLFYIYNSTVYYNKDKKQTGSLSGKNVDHTDQGEISLYEINADAQELAYPFITKGSNRDNFRTVSASTFSSNYVFGDKITGSYPLSATIRRDFYSQGSSRRKVDALKNTLNLKKKRSPRHAFSASFGDKGSQKLNLISIPSIFYGSKVKPGSVSLDFWYSGSLAGRLEDEEKNGELVQTKPSGSAGSGSIAGVCLYEEGFVLLTGSWALNNKTEDFEDNSTQDKPEWTYFGAGIEDDFSGGVVTASSYQLDFRGKTYTQNIKMFAEMPKGQFNHSNNPTFVKKGQDKTPNTSSDQYIQPSNLKVKNTQKSPYTDPTASFERETYVNKVNIYDENKRLLGVAKLATPVRKIEGRSYTIKLSLDI